VNEVARLSEQLTVNIRPEVTILSVLQHLNYRPWFALAEFVDNSLQSFLLNKDRILDADGSRTVLTVEIDVDGDGPGRIAIRDNAAGIHKPEFPRAFRPADVPMDRSGLSEFGMGMKSAACWFAAKWSVRTKALGEDVERTVRLDIREIVSTNNDRVVVSERPAQPNEHYTEVVLEELHHPPKGRALGKIKEHLASIYRVFIRQGVLQLKFKGEILSSLSPPVLVAHYYRDPAGEILTWKKDIDLDFGQGQRVRGFAALRETASISFAGFALFRRDRLIEGSLDETYRPLRIFGNSNSYRYQRLFGELHLEGFGISHTKDGFRWEEHEDVFLDLLKEELERAPLNLLDQAEGHRIRATRKAMSAKAKSATDAVADVVETDVPPIIEKEIQDRQDRGPLPLDIEVSPEELSSKVVNFECAGQKWEVTIRTSIDPAQGDWLRIGERHVRLEENGQKVRCVAMDVSLAHPFVTTFVGPHNENVELILRMATAVALSLIIAEDTTSVSPSFALHYLNTLLRDALSHV
jgi:hypothetical protein